MSKPFFKWVGGKTQLLPDLTRLIPVTPGTYYEPFIGGGSSFFYFHSLKRFKRAILNDVNPELINCYTMVRDRLPELIDGLTIVAANPEWNTLPYFLSMRGSAPSDQIGRAVRFLYLLKTCFNGLWRVNQAGKFNTPFGYYKNPTLCDPERLRACSEALQTAELRLGDFSSAIKDAEPGDLVYFDPPYVPVSKTSNFTAYAGGFGPEQQEALAKAFRDLVDRGVVCVESNSDAPTVRELYQGFQFNVVQARRNINSDGEKRGKINELVIVGAPTDMRLSEMSTVFDSLD